MKTETKKLSLRDFLNEEGLKFFETEIQLRNDEIAQKGIKFKPPKPAPCSCPPDDPICFCIKSPTGRCLCF
jgi:hypothetical protein